MKKVGGSLTKAQLEHEQSVLKYVVFNMIFTNFNNKITVHWESLERLLSQKSLEIIVLEELFIFTHNFNWLFFPYTLCFKATLTI